VACPRESIRAGRARRQVDRRSEKAVTDAQRALG
jgi:hypothetical protein